MKKIIIILVFLVVMPEARSAAQSVAVLPFENIGQSRELEWLTMGIPETITNDLLLIPGIVLVERLQIRNLIEEQKIQLKGLVDENTAVSVGKMIGADIVVLGAFQKSGNIIRLTARFVDVENGSIVQSTKTTGPMDKIFDLQDDIVKGFAAKLNIELKPQELNRISQQPTNSIEAYRHFGQGVLLQAGMDGQGSLKEFQKAAELDPGFKIAKDKFKEVFWSLEEGNYWLYDMRGNIPGVFGSAKMDRIVTRHAGPVKIFKAGTAFSYYRDLNDSSGKDQSKERSGEFYIKGEKGIMKAGSYFAFLKKDGKTPSGEYFYEFNPLPFYFPYDLKSGTNWTNQYVTDVQTPMGYHQAKVLETCQVKQTEEISVPAGKFKCLPVTVIAQWRGNVENEDRVSTFWFAPGVGIVKSIIATYKVDSSGQRSKKSSWDFREELKQFKIK